MRLSYLIKLTAISLLGFLPFQNAFAGCGCSENKDSNQSYVESNSNAETQQEPLEDDDQIL